MAQWPSPSREVFNSQQPAAAQREEGCAGGPWDLFSLALGWRRAGEAGSHMRRASECCSALRPPGSAPDQESVEQNLGPQTLFNKPEDEGPNGTKAAHGCPPPDQGNVIVW